MTDLNKVNFMSKTRFDNLSVTNDDELYLVETNIAVDEDVVHKSGNETIGGNKTFSNNIVVTGTTTLNNALTVNNNVAVTGTTTFGSNVKVSGILLIPNNANSNASYSNAFIELMPSTTSSFGGYVDFHYAGSSDDYTSRIIESASGDITYVGSQRDTASNSTTSGTLAVKGWVNDPAKSTNVVHRTGDESIAGRKTFAQSTFMQGGNDMSYAIKSINADNNAETQSVQTLASFRNIDNNGLIIGDVRFQKGTNGTTTSMLIARNYYGSSSEIGVNAIISCAVDNEGNVYTSAPTPPTTDNSTQIATTAYVNSKLSNVLPTDYIVEYQSPTGTDARWYRKWNSGWIEQGASGSNASGNNPQIGLVKSFSNTSYTLVVSGSTTNTGGAWYGPGIYAKTKNNFTLYATHSSTVDWYACGF